MTINVNSKKKYIEIRRTVLTDTQSEKNYKSEILEWARIIKHEKPISQLVDERNMRFIIIPELQNWINKVLIMPAIEAGLRKVAFLLPEELFAQISVEQTMDENDSRLLKVKYFETEEEAQEGLI